MLLFILDLSSRRPQLVRSQWGRCHVIRTGTRAVPHQVAVAPLIILSPIVTRCNSPSHDWWCRCLITPRQNPFKITFRPRGQLHELHEVCWRARRGGGGGLGGHVDLLSHAHQVSIYFSARISTVVYDKLSNANISLNAHDIWCWTFLAIFGEVDSCLIDLDSNYLDAENKTLSKVCVIRSFVWCGRKRNKKAPV